MNKRIILFTVLGLFLITGCTTPPPSVVVKDADSLVPKKDTKVSIEVKGADEETEKTPVSDTATETDITMVDDENLEVANDDSPVYEDYSRTKYVALKGKEPFILFFHANGCPICSRMETEITADLKNYPKGTRFFKVDFDTENELKKEFGILVQSMVVVVDGSGKTIYTSQDPALDDLKAAIEKSMANL